MAPTYSNYPGRPNISPELTEIIPRMARENRSWEYDRMAGALQNLNHSAYGRTVGNILHCFGISLAPIRREQIGWADFVRSHIPVLQASAFSKRKC